MPNTIRYDIVRNALNNLGARCLAVHTLTQEKNMVPNQDLEFWALNGKVVILQHWKGNNEGIELYRPLALTYNMADLLIEMSLYLAPEEA